MNRDRVGPFLAVASVVLVRALHPGQPIVENYVGRQIPTAMVARNLERGSGFLRPQLDTAPFPNLFLVEPPIYAQLVATARRATGLDRGVCGRLVSALSTGLAAWGLYGLARRREGPRVALVAVLVFGVFPVTIRYGRAFQPDALMLGLLVGGMRLLDDFENEKGLRRLLAALLLIALGLAVKVVSAYILVPLVLVIVRPPRRWKPVAVAACVVPALLWYGYVVSLPIEGSRASADNAALWSRALGLTALAKVETWTNSARFLFVRCFTPFGFLLALWGLFGIRGADRLWRIWLLAAAAGFAVMAGKIHHEYYWMGLAPMNAVGVARSVVCGSSGRDLAPGSRGWAFQAAVLLALAGCGLLQSASTWKTPAEWADLPRLIASPGSVAGGDVSVPDLIASEAVLYYLDRRGFRLESEPRARVRAAGEFGATIDPADPLALIEFYRSRGARLFVDLPPGDGDVHRRLLHDAIRGRYKVGNEADGVLRAELVPTDIRQVTSDGMPTEPAPVTLPDFARWKAEGRKIGVLTAYDFPTSRLLDSAGVDCLLVGDTLGMVVQGHETTLPVTLDQMIYHTEMVARGASRAFVVGDLPFLSYQVSVEDALRSGGRFLKETKCGAVKLEGGRRLAPTIRAMVEAGIPVMGHVGLRPQSVKAMGGYRVQRDGEAILADSLAVAEAGAFAIVLECIPASVASRITSELSIPTIGIGAGPDCDGQVLVTPDVLGLFEGFRPRFVRRYAEVGETIRDAARAYLADVADGRFPSESESFR